MENDWRTRWVKFKEKAIIGHWIDEDDGHQEEYNTYLSEFDTTKIENFISQELDKARREYFSMGMEYFSLIDDSNICQKKGWELSEEKAERLQILDKMFNLLKDNK